MRKSFTLFLAVLMLLLPLSACQKKTPDPTPTEQPTNTTEAPTETSEPAPDIPSSLKKDQLTDYHIFTQGWWGYAPLDVTDIGVDEEVESDLVIRAAFSRDSAMAERWNVHIVNDAQTECYNSFDVLQTNILGGCTYDLVLLRSAVYTRAIQNDLLLDLTSPDLTYFSPEKSWWDKDSYESLSLFGHHYGICGDFTVSDDMTLWALFFNKDMRAANEFDNPYDLVKNQTWTYEAMYRMAKGAARNLDTDPAMTYEDQWGVTYLRDTVSGMINSIGIRFGETDEDGIPFIGFYNDANVTKILKIFDYLYDTDTCYNIHAKGGDEIAVFTEGRALFTFGGIYYAPQMRQAETDVNFGILPYPKYDTAQEDYISSVSPLFLTVLCIPKNCVNEDLNFKSAVMEEYAYYGQKIVVPEFYDRLLLGRVAKDVETQEILDFIFGNVTFDIGNIFNFGDLPFRVIDMTITSDRNIASVYGNYGNAANGAIEALIKKFS